VADVAEKLGICAATVYRLCERRELPHVRIVNSIRIQPSDLDALIAGSRQHKGETSRIGTKGDGPKRRAD
jgi:excisionase family DNA binding protein